MKKILIFLFLVTLILGFWYFIKSQKEGDLNQNNLSIENITPTESVINVYNWDDVKRFAQNCEIKKGLSPHSGNLSITLKNGEEFTIKDRGIFKLLDENKDKCGYVPFAIE